MRFFISFTDDGEEHAKKLERDLKDQNIGTWIYKSKIKLGQIWLKEIDDALYRVDYALGVITENYLNSIGGGEAYAKISEGLQKKEIKFIPLFFVPREKIKSVFLPAMQGIDFFKDYESGLRGLIEFLRGEEGENTKAGFIKDFSFKTEITPEYATMITVGAAANGAVVGANSTALSKLNIGLEDRFKTEVLDTFN